jgi:hypothetical protein
VNAAAASDNGLNSFADTLCVVDSCRDRCREVCEFPRLQKQRTSTKREPERFGKHSIRQTIAHCKTEFYLLAPPTNNISQRVHDLAAVDDDDGCDANASDGCVVGTDTKKDKKERSK